MTNELKPCPFCGGEAEYRAAKYVRTAFKHSVVCLECFASIPPKDSKHEAINAWNTRVERTCKPIAKFNYDDSPWPVMVCSECDRRLHYDETKYGLEYSPYCGCGAKVVE